MSTPDETKSTPDETKSPIDETKLPSEARVSSHDLGDCEYCKGRKHRYPMVLRYRRYTWSNDSRVMDFAIKTAEQGLAVDIC